MRFIRWLLAFMWGDIWDSHTATTSQIAALQKSVDSLSRCSNELLLRVKLMVNAINSKGGRDVDGENKSPWTMIVKSYKGNDGGLLDLQLARQVLEKMGLVCSDIRYTQPIAYNWDKVDLEEVAVRLFVPEEEREEFKKSLFEIKVNKSPIEMIKLVRSYGALKGASLITCKAFVDSIIR